MNNRSLSAERRRKTVLSVVLGIICIIYVLPVLTVVINSFKLNTYVKPPPSPCRTQRALPVVPTSSSV